MIMCPSCGKSNCDCNAVRAVPRTAARMPLLTERENTHGDFLLVAKVAQEIKEAIRWAPKELSVDKKESLDLIATKIARIVIGDQNEEEHWIDIKGYAELALEQIRKSKKS
jgi:hypothetical protein